MNGLSESLIADRGEVLMLDGWRMLQQLADGLISFLNTVVHTPSPMDMELPVKFWLVILGCAVGLVTGLVLHLRRSS